TIQLTSYARWQDVVSVMKPLFDKARKPEPGSPLLVEAGTIAKAHATPETRMLAALRLTQEKVRYVALALGEGTHIPATGDQTWTRKFGDCKGKVAMLLALLDRLGVAAEPTLTSGRASELLSGSLPSLYAFDHVVIKASIGGRDYLLDPTNYGQRTLDELISPNFHWGLPLVEDAQPWQIAQVPSRRPQTETEIVWDASKGFDQQVPFKATLTYRDSAASLVRALQAGAPDRSAMEKYLKDAMPSIGNDELQVTAIEADGKQGEFSVRFHGKAPMDWSRKIAGREFRFDHSVPSWRIDFGRANGPWKELPVTMNFPVWVRSTESIILPAGGTGFTIRGKSVDASVAGKEIKRVTTLNAGRATTVADFRGLFAEITAKDARAASSTLDRIASDVAYVVAPKDYVVSKAEVKAIIGEETSGYDGYVERARLLMDESEQAKAIGELAKAIKLDATRPEAPALQSINYFYSSKYTEARTALSKALAIDPENREVVRAHGLVAWYERDGASALRLIGRAIELNPDFHGLYNVRAKIRAGLGRYDEALADLRRASELSNEAVSPDMIALLEAASGKLADALITIDKADKNRDSDDGYLLVLRGDFLTRLGRPEEAKIAYRAAADQMRKFFLKKIKSYPKPVGAESDLEFQVLMASRNYPEAEPLADRIIARQRYPSATNLGKRAWLRAMNGKYNAAISDARAALGLDPSDADANLSLTLAYLRTGKYAEAETQATKALVSNEGHAMFQYARAIARAQRGDQAGAMRDFSSARLWRFDVKLDPAFLGLKAN
ncbi:MAG: tetratricopeptide repeat protein, partial [Sphingomonas bacterium]|nr:tetratricopeptide repeat protein [Sphingomonas bacterium]